MVEAQDIYLERDPKHPTQEMLVGLNGETDVDPVITLAVCNNGRLFPYVVMHLAGNRHTQGMVDTAPGSDDKEALHQHTRAVRDELKTAVDGLRETLNNHWAMRIPHESRRRKPPYMWR